MIKSNNTISRDMLDIIRACKGRKVETLLLTEQDCKTSFEVVILRFKEYDLEIWSLEQPYKEGEIEDLASVIVKINPDKNTKSTLGTNDKKGVFHLRGFTRVPIGKTVKGITVHNELVQWTYEDESFLLANTYAIVISLGTRYLHLVKDPFWSEIWDMSFHRTSIPKAPEWDESEGDKYEITYSVFEL